MEKEENPQLEKYKEELAIDSKIDLANILEKSLSVTAIVSKWIVYRQNEIANIDKINSIIQQLLKSRMETQGATSVLRLKSEDHLMSNDEKLIKLKKLKKNSEECKDFIEMSLNNLKNMVWQIKETVKILELQGYHA